MTTTARPAISSYVTPETSAGHLTLGRQNAEPQSPRGNPGGGGSRGHPPTSYSTMPHPRRSQLSSNSNSASTFNTRGQPQTNKGGTRLQHSQSQRYSVNYQEEMRRQAYIQSLGKNRGSVMVLLRMTHISIARNHKNTNAIFFPPSSLPIFLNAAFCLRWIRRSQQKWRKIRGVGLVMMISG